MHQMPQLTEQHLKLQAFVGDWDAEETLSASPWGPAGVALGKSQARVGLDGFFVLHDYVQEKAGQVVFRGHGIFGWDGNAPEGGCYTWYWVDSMGSVPAQPARGQWQGDTLSLLSTSPRGMARYTYRFVDQRTYDFSIENSFDGGATWLTFLTSTYRKR